MTPKSQGHCWICPLGCLFVPSRHPHHQHLCDKLLIFANKGSHPVFRLHQTVFELCPHKIHRLKQTFPKAVPLILLTLEGLSLNEVAPEVKLFVRLCDTTAHQYEHCLTDFSSLLTHPRKESLSELCALPRLDPIYTGEEYFDNSFQCPTDLDIVHAKRQYNVRPDWNGENPCWVFPPNIFFVDGNCDEFERLCCLLNCYAVLSRDDFYVNQCVF